MKQRAKKPWQLVSGFFREASEVRTVLTELLNLGVPRDLIEVVVDARTVKKYFSRGRVRKLNSSFASAARGALTGLLLFSLASAALIVSSGATENQRLTWIMLLGPNIGVMLGAIVGLLWGLFRKPPLPARYARLREAEGILLIARTRVPELAEAIRQKLEECGARSVVVE